MIAMRKEEWLLVVCWGWFKLYNKEDRMKTIELQREISKLQAEIITKDKEFLSKKQKY